MRMHIFTEIRRRRWLNREVQCRLRTDMNRIFGTLCNNPPFLFLFPHHQEHHSQRQQTLHCNSNSVSRAPSYPLTLSPFPPQQAVFRSSSTCQQLTKRPSAKGSIQDFTQVFLNTYTRSHLTRSSLFTGRSFRFKANPPLVSSIQKQTSRNNVRRCRIRPRGQPPS